ncbi:MAG: DUF1275 domain-containing protein [Clostridiales bacterium]|nr:MAG: DUF1275 domain-containing protein [Clostridiales bacterium]
MKKAKGQMSETFLLGSLLAVVGGFLDAYTYLLRGHVFANAQTGNIVLLGLNLAEMDLLQAAYYFIPIAAFAAGIVVAELIRRVFREHPRIHWRQIIIAAECLILLGVAFLPSGELDVAVNIAISFLCAMQVESFRKVNGNAYATTMCTGNLRSGTELFYRYMQTKNPCERSKAFQYYGIILFFIAGAVLGSFFSQLLLEKAVLICCSILAVVFSIMFIQEDLPEIEKTAEQNKRDS